VSVPMWADKELLRSISVHPSIPPFVSLSFSEAKVRKRDKEPKVVSGEERVFRCGHFSCDT